MLNSEGKLGSLIALVEAERIAIDRLEAAAAEKINRHNREIEAIRSTLVTECAPHKKELTRLARVTLNTVAKEEDWKRIAEELGAVGEELRVASGVIERTWLGPELKIADAAAALFSIVKLGLQKKFIRRKVERVINREEMYRDKTDARKVKGVSFIRERILRLRLSTQGPDDKPLSTKTIASEDFTGD